MKYALSLPSYFEKQNGKSKAKAWLKNGSSFFNVAR